MLPGQLPRAWLLLSLQPPLQALQFERHCSVWEHRKGQKEPAGGEKKCHENKTDMKDVLNGTYV